MKPEEVLANVKEHMKKAVEYMGHEFSSVRTGKASPALVENLDVMVSSYGSSMKLKALAVITTPEPRMIMIQPFDPSTTGDIEKAIRESKLGLNPVGEGKVIRLPIPELTEERRKDLVKTLKHMAEETRVRVRACRKEGMDGAKKLKSEGILTEDQMHDLEKDVQELTDQFVKEIDGLFDAKEKEVMTV
ncbi:MAG: ribosome recycling factor [Akkermansiaceae bacterium]|nr:ribosome recycling factor [Akkermansiaceae bacterium]